QLCGIEPQAMFGRINTVSAKAVTRTRTSVGDDQSVNVAFTAHHWQARHLFFPGRIEKTKIDLGGVPGRDGAFRSVLRLHRAFWENGRCLHYRSQLDNICSERHRQNRRVRNPPPSSSSKPEDDAAQGGGRVTPTSCFVNSSYCARLSQEKA